MGTSVLAGTAIPDLVAMMMSGMEMMTPVEERTGTREHHMFPDVEIQFLVLLEAEEQRGDLATAPDPHVAVAVSGRLNSFGRELVDVYLVDASSGDVKRVCARRCDRAGEVSTHGGMVLLVDNNQMIRVLDPASGAVSLVPDYKNHPNNYSFTLGRTASTGEYKALRIRTDEDLWGGLLLGPHPRPRPPRAVEECTEPTSDRQHAAQAEQWQPDLIGGPPETEKDRLHVTLAELRGSLVVAQDDHRAATLDLWFLLAGSGDGKVGQQHWSKQYTVTMPYHGRPWWWWGESAEPVVVLDDGRIVFWVWPSNSLRGGVMRVYDPITSGQTDVAAEAKCTHVGVYTGSLLRLP
ncbi:hypothetical protein E2562_026815 [Oryza meyeriana var. granulata]|uniref:Uncharacterized protein n=1 Tax=Oryza meyeriana var. granulata TaxID=110450 RepID=A0A6G1CIU0_9ORYZ|nr:hypothetical protein E2562_026815 [Oryza meyeriana var. granulata]